MTKQLICTVKSIKMCPPPPEIIIIIIKNKKIKIKKILADQLGVGARALVIHWFGSKHNYKLLINCLFINQPNTIITN